MLFLETYRLLLYLLVWVLVPTIILVLYLYCIYSIVLFAEIQFMYIVYIIGTITYIDIP